MREGEEGRVRVERTRRGVIKDRGEKYNKTEEEEHKEQQRKGLGQEGKTEIRN